MELIPIIRIKDPSLEFIDGEGEKDSKYTHISEIIPGTDLDSEIDGEYMIIWGQYCGVYTPMTLDQIKDGKFVFLRTYRKDLKKLKEFQERKKDYEIEFKIVK